MTNKSLSHLAYPSGRPALRQFPLESTEDYSPYCFIRDFALLRNSTWFNRTKRVKQVFGIELARQHRLSTRGTHAYIAMRCGSYISQKLGLMQPLVDASNIGHDIFHSPMSHDGEKIICEYYPDFSHERAGVILSQFFGFNLCFETLMGILHHGSKETLSSSLPPENILPWPCDKVSYSAYDPFDALKMLSQGPCPEIPYDQGHYKVVTEEIRELLSPLGHTPAKVARTLCDALVSESLQAGRISFSQSDQVRSMLGLRDYMYRTIYHVRSNSHYETKFRMVLEFFIRHFSGICHPALTIVGMDDYWLLRTAKTIEDGTFPFWVEEMTRDYYLRMGVKCLPPPEISLVPNLTWAGAKTS
jgi:dGTPase